MKSKKRSWIKRSGLIMSAVVSLAAPTGKENLSGSAKAKSSKKARATQLVDDDENELAGGRPPETPAGDRPPKRRTMRVAVRTTMHAEAALPPTLNIPPAPKMRAHRHVPAPVEEVASNASSLPPPASIDPNAVGSGPLAESPITRLGPPMSETPAAPKLGYEWKKHISTTVFWIGETPTDNNPTPNHASSWDAHWASNYGGFDDPNHRDGFLPAKFTPKQNPFYVALPYNDVTPEGHKPEARRLIPWFDAHATKDPVTGRTRSMCKGRWIAIRKGSRVCYAQWEDAGPFTTDDADYVFGHAKPKPNANHNAGLDVSPAVRDYLGLDGDDITDWKFVEFAEIPHGPWALHGSNNDFVQHDQTSGAPAVAMTSEPKHREHNADGS